MLDGLIDKVSQTVADVSQTVSDTVVDVSQKVSNTVTEVGLRVQDTVTDLEDWSNDTTTSNNNNGVADFSSSASHIKLSASRPLSHYYEDVTLVASEKFKLTYLAKHKATGQYRAIRFLPKASVPANFFWGGVEVYQALANHPNVIHFYGSLEDRTYYYAIFDRFDVPNLYEAIPQIFKKDPSAFDERQVALVIRTILETLVFCHSKGIVHSDLDFQNILVDIQGKGNELKNLYITGFGASRLYREYRIYRHHESATHRFVHDDDSPRNADDEGVDPDDWFVAPETRNGDLSDFVEAGDVWSTGIIAYQLLARYHPFENKKVLPKSFNDPVWKLKHFATAPYLQHLSPEAKDFLSSLLVYDMEVRPTAEKSLEHPWLRTSRGAERKVQKGDIMNCLANLQNFQATSQLEKSARLYIVANLLDAKDRSRLDACFRHLDYKKNNVITKKELHTALKKVRVNDEGDSVESMLEATFDRIDTDKTGEIEYDEFLAAAADDSVVLTRRNLKTTFDAFDRSNTGTITKEDIRELFTRGKNNKLLSHREARRIMQEVDANGDGDIDFEEFCQMMHAGNLF